MESNGSSERGVLTSGSVLIVGSAAARPGVDSNGGEDDPPLDHLLVRRIDVEQVEAVPDHREEQNAEQVRQTAPVRPKCSFRRSRLPRSRSTRSHPRIRLAGEMRRHDDPGEAAEGRKSRSGALTLDTRIPDSPPPSRWRRRHTRNGRTSYTRAGTRSGRTPGRSRRVLDSQESPVPSVSKPGSVTVMRSVGETEPKPRIIKLERAFR